MADDTWNPAVYERFRKERSQPFQDLAALVEPRPDMRVIDLGCGTGELTKTLHDRLSARQTLGIDSSDAMLSRSVAFQAPGLSFEKRDIAEIARGWRRTPRPDAYDLVFSNAAIHWVPDHRELLAQLASGLREDGQLAIQIPANDDHPAHAVARAVAREPPFAQALAGFVQREPVHPPETYAGWLHDLGFERQHVRLVVYPHVLPSREGVLEWVSGALLVDYEKRLGSELFAAFRGRYREALMQELPERRPLFYPFKRILFWGARS